MTGGGSTSSCSSMEGPLACRTSPACPSPRCARSPTFSWLGLPHHGKGLGREMRSAVLHLAFEGLGAQRAESEAFEDNHASNRVSLALGYRPNGTGWGIRKGAAAPMVRYLLTRDRWLERRRDDINISGLEPCRVMLGL